LPRVGEPADGDGVEERAQAIEHAASAPFIVEMKLKRRA
jgi:hypothetical protein